MVRATTHIRMLKDPQLNTTALAFKRSNSTPAQPTGGSYDSPLPTSGGWTAQVPTGEEKLWVVTRIFTSDGLEPQQENWSSPRPLSDTADFDMLFSSVQAPNPPSGHPNTNMQWSDTSTGTTLWMAVSRKRNGTWTAWQVFKTRGNDGTSITPKGSFKYYYQTSSAADAAAANGTWQQGEYAITVWNGVPVVGLRTAGGVTYTEAQEFDPWMKADTGELFVAGISGWTNVGQIRGDRGPQGNSAYIHIKFATSMTRNSWTTDNGETPGPYIGIYADTNAADPLDWDLYSWMQWKGADGYGYEYIYKRTSSSSAPAVPVVLSSPATNADGYVPTGWSADPVSPTAVYQYCWFCYRKKVDGVWNAWRGSDAVTAALWSKYGDRGPQGDNSYVHIKFANSLTTNDWTDNDGETPGPYIGIYADNTQSASLVWSKYSWMQWKGEDGYGYEYIYKLSNSSTPLNVPSTSTNTDQSVPDGWSADPLSPTLSNKYCWVCYRKKVNAVWSAWRGSDASHATLWTKYAEQGPQGPQGPASVTYQLMPSTESIDFHSKGNGASYTPGYVTLTCGYVKTEGSTQTRYGFPTNCYVDDYYLMFRLIKADDTPLATFGGEQPEGWDWIDNNDYDYKDGAGNLIIPSTTTYTAVEFALSKVPPRMANDNTIIADARVPIHRIKDGDRGPRLCGPLDWNECSIGFQFMQGAENEQKYHVILYNEHLYSCEKSHVKAADNYPGSTKDSQQGLWGLATEQNFVATKIMLATYALVKNLGVECIDMRDANDNIIFQAKGGNVTCKKGVFDNVEIKSGKIGGFKISGSMLTNRLDDSGTDNPDASVIFMKKVSGSMRRYAGIGSGVSNFLTGAITMARIENNEPSSGAIPNYALYLAATGAARNFAFHGKGNGVLDGYIEGVHYHQPLEISSMYYNGYTHLRVTNRIVVKATSSNGALMLPKYQDVCAELGLDTSKAFCLRLLYLSDPKSQTWKLYGRCNVTTSAESEDYPLLIKRDSSVGTYISMPCCYSAEVLLVYDPTRTENYGQNSLKYSARVLFG